MNITDTTLQQINEVYAIDWYDDYLNTVRKENATKLYISWEKTSGEDWKAVGVTLPIPKKKEITLDWVCERVTTKMGGSKVMTDFSAKFKTLIKERGHHGFTVYPTSYGIGVSVLFRGGEADTNIKEVENLLNELGVLYTTEYSDANWVYRFRISKSKENISRIETI